MTDVIFWGWVIVTVYLLLRCSYLSWRLDHGGKTAREIWRENRG